jgi:hypothetical protein
MWLTLFNRIKYTKTISINSNSSNDTKLMESNYQANENRSKNTPQMRQWLESVHEQRFLTNLERRIDKRREEYMRLKAFDRRGIGSVEPIDELELHLHIFSGVCE